MPGSPRKKGGPKAAPAPAPAPAPVDKKKASARGRRGAKAAGPVEKAAAPARPGGGFNLVLLESPAKAKTIAGFLGKGYVVKASMGHIRDLPKGRLGVDPAKDFETEYELIKAKQKTITALRKDADRADRIFLATDLDREGEAIAWHLCHALKIPKGKAVRVIFNEITKPAIQRAFAHPGTIDLRKVNAQQTRRILDRIVGYKISPLLWKKIAKGLSAGRVQSVAARLITDREKAIQAFVPEEFWRIKGKFRTEKGEEFDAELKSAKPEETAPAEAKEPEPEEAEGAEEKPPKGDRIRNQGEAEALASEIKKTAFEVEAYVEKEQAMRPRPPHTTSLLQQDANIQLSFPAKMTMAIAQQLYEGIELGGEGAVGLITYMRTDSFQVAAEAVQAVRAFIRERIGPEFLPERPNSYASRKSAQEAHEAIRPTDAARALDPISATDAPLAAPDGIRKFLTVEQAKLYDLIFRRFTASQMNEARYLAQDAKVHGGRFLFAGKGSRLVFEGYQRVWKESRKEDQPLPALRLKERLELVGLAPTQHFTQPPPRYTEASLVRTLEKEGIGRPSTYAQILSTIQDRGYVKKEQGRFFATELGTLVTDKLIAHFPEILDLKFTSEMEEKLDRIEEDEADWVRILKDFYGPFEKTLALAVKMMGEEREKPEDSGIMCEKCGKPMVKKFSRHGPFLACSGFPACRNARSLDRKPPQPAEGVFCEKCGKQMMIIEGRTGRFMGCSAYPDCKTTLPLPTGVKCPKCGGEVVQRRMRKGKRTFFGCKNYPACDYTTNKLEEAPEPAAAPAGAAGAFVPASAPVPGPGGSAAPPAPPSQENPERRVSGDSA